MDFSSVFFGTAPQAEQQAGLDYEKRQFDAALARRQASGTIDPGSVAKDETFENSVFLGSDNQAAEEGFIEGAKDGLHNVEAFPGEVIGATSAATGSVLGGILKNVPWWAWLLILAYVITELGLWRSVTKRK